MLQFLKDHPFAVKAFFDSSLVLTFAVPREELLALLPKHLEVDAFQDTWGFVAAAYVKTRRLRPGTFPEFMGNDFILVGYRIFVRYRDLRGRNLRGLYILKSETDKKRMAFLGNIFTHYKYTWTDIAWNRNGDLEKIHSENSGFNVEFASESGPDVQLPQGSPFADWHEARRFAGPLPFTFTFDESQNKMLIVEGVRQNWNPLPVHVLNYRIPFIESLHFKEIRLANAFMIRNVPYRWKKGVVEFTK